LKLIILKKSVGVCLACKERGGNNERMNVIELVDEGRGELGVSTSSNM